MEQKEDPSADSNVSTDTVDEAARGVDEPSVGQKDSSATEVQEDPPVPHPEPLAEGQENIANVTGVVDTAQFIVSDIDKGNLQPDPKANTSSAASVPEDELTEAQPLNQQRSDQ